MCDYFDDFDGEFMDEVFYEDHFDDDLDDIEMEDSMDPGTDDDLTQGDDRCDGFDWDEAYWIGTGIGWTYEEGKRKRQRRNNADSDDPSDIG